MAQDNTQLVHDHLARFIGETAAFAILALAIVSSEGLVFLGIHEVLVHTADAVEEGDIVTRVGAKALL